MVGAPLTARVGRSRMLPFGTPAQRLHEVYDLGRFSIMRDFDLFASVLFTQQFFQRPLVVILEFFRIEMSGFGFDDMRCKIEHVLGHSLARDIIKIISFVTGPLFLFSDSAPFFSVLL
jgi:hypothetical protein